MLPTANLPPSLLSIIMLGVAAGESPNLPDRRGLELNDVDESYAQCSHWAFPSMADSSINNKEEAFLPVEQEAQTISPQESMEDVTLPPPRPPSLPECIRRQLLELAAQPRHCFGCDDEWVFLGRNARLEFAHHVPS